VTSSALLILTLALHAGAGTETAARETAPAPFCVAQPGPEYYQFPLTTTRSIPGTGAARGLAVIAAPSTSPFPVALASDGSYLYDVHVRIERMKPPATGRLVAWVTTPELDRIERMGALDEHMTTTGSVSWNKFIVVVTLEADDAADRETWAGPIVFRGMSRSGAMHTMLGHGALQQENCTSYGFGG
jgi:hypothetical protein